MISKINIRYEGVGFKDPLLNPTGMEPAPTLGAACITKALNSAHEVAIGFILLLATHP